MAGTATAIIVPIVADLNNKKYGQVKQIPSTVLAASCVDNLFSIRKFS